ncbi:MAG: ATPase [Hadesarchaea archaeon]|nr:ATPase [Hadesarchaea archaeon]
MTINVVKKNGNKESFQHKKIVDSCLAAGAPSDVAAGIADRIEKSANDGITTKEIRDNILQELSELKHEWAEAWKEYEKSKGED